jgi:Flp pilus assembly pilin Flp
MYSGLQFLWHDEQGQDIAEYAVMLAVILIIVVGTIRLIGSNANNVFSSVAVRFSNRRVTSTQLPMLVVGDIDNELGACPRRDSGNDAGSLSLATNWVDFPLVAETRRYQLLGRKMFI